MIKIEQSIRVETYQFIDNLNHVISPKDVYDEIQYENLVNKVKQAFEEAGWEGDGEIGLIWLPPFVLENGNDTCGRYVWHVKQDNNGISFLGYIENEVEQEIKYNQKKLDEETITKSISAYMLDEIKRTRILLSDLNKTKEEGIIDSLYHITLNALQNQIIAGFIDYIDEIYLEYAEHVLGQNNPDGIKLAKTKVNLPLDTISDGIEDGYMDSWLILKSIVSALWKDFKFWKFSDKFREICRCIDFNCPDDIRRMIVKHVEIRNSIQHHGGQFTADSSKVIGQNYLILLDDDNTERRINVWGDITLSICEVKELLGALEKFTDLYEKQVEKRMSTRIYRYLQV